jgi:hypothetical protein
MSLLNGVGLTLHTNSGSERSMAQGLSIALSRTSSRPWKALRRVRHDYPSTVVDDKVQKGKLRVAGTGFSQRLDSYPTASPSLGLSAFTIVLARVLPAVAYTLPSQAAQVVR